MVLAGLKWRLAPLRTWMLRRHNKLVVNPPCSLPCSRHRHTIICEQLQDARHLQLSVVVYPSPTKMNTKLVNSKQVSTYRVFYIYIAFWSDDILHGNEVAVDRGPLKRVSSVLKDLNWENGILMYRSHTLRGNREILSQLSCGTSRVLSIIYHIRMKRIQANASPSFLRIMFDLCPPNNFFCTASWEDFDLIKV